MTCQREDELLDALARGFLGDELAAHVASCASCEELRTVAGALLDDRSTTMLEAPVPSASTMWLRMRMRERTEAEARARRSLLIGQAVTLAAAIALVVAFFGGQVAGELAGAVGAIRNNTILFIAFTASLLLAPAAVLIGNSERRGASASPSARAR
ncbi:MAG: hypothetical protein JOZ54_13340 [Acidobacteria bacterium]|nr:hypothetical protein [Acidobacteriota bacterium]